MTASTAAPGTVDIDERSAWNINGFLPALAAFLLFVIPVGWFVTLVVNDTDPSTGSIVAGVIAILIAVTIATGLDVVQPGATKVVQFFGRYAGTVRTTGFILTLPFSQRSLVSVRVSNFETSELKVNDAEGNPVNIAAIIVWQVEDTAKALFAVEDYADFVRVQSESALRHVAMSHPYDHPSDGTTSLRGATEQVALEIADQVQDRVALAGVQILEARISKLAYAPEIAQAMLQRQQAGAILAARERIVDGAVGMVQAALQRLENDDIVTLDDERKAAMVSNLLVVLCGDSRATPIVNTGTLYT